MRHCRSVALLLLTASLSTTAVPSKAASAEKAAGSSAVRAGEALTYDVDWQGAPGGTVEIRVGEPVARKNRRAYAITGRAASNVAVDQIFRVRTSVTSWTDVKTLTSLGYMEQAEEGTHRRNQTVFIDPEKKSFSSREAASRAAVTGRCPAGVQDILSAFFHVRARPLTVGTRVTFSVLHNETVQEIALHVLSRETVETAFGPRPCVKAELVPRPTAGAAWPDLRLHVWFTDDSRHIPVRFISDLPLGRVTGELSDYKAG